MKNICHNFYRKIIFNASALLRPKWIIKVSNTDYHANKLAFTYHLMLDFPIGYSKTAWDRYDRCIVLMVKS